MDFDIHESYREVYFCGWLNALFPEMARGLLEARNGNFDNFFLECVQKGLLSVNIHNFLDAILLCAPLDQKREGALKIIQAKRLKNQDPIWNRRVLSHANCEILHHALSWLRKLCRHAKGRAPQKAEQAELLLAAAEKSYKAENALLAARDASMFFTPMASQYVQESLFTFSVAVLDN